MPLHRSTWFLRNYRFLPHRLLNGGLAKLTALEHPAWLVDRIIDRWVARDNIDLSQFEARRYRSIDDFFLRQLRPGARPLAAGFVSPVDGNVFAHGFLKVDQVLTIKGQRLTVDRIVNAGQEPSARLDLRAFDGGCFAAIFLTPRGYHHVHMPEQGCLQELRWIPGRYFPQNEDAMWQIPRIYERNERAVLCLQDAQNNPFLLVMIGASLIGGIVIEGTNNKDWRQPRPTIVNRVLKKGQRLGHFAFGSTVLVLVPPGPYRPRKLEAEIQLGEPLFAVATH